MKLRFYELINKLEFRKPAVKKYERFVHLSVAELLKNEISNEMKEKIAKGGVGKAPASLIVKLIKAAMESHGWPKAGHLGPGSERETALRICLCVHCAAFAGQDGYCLFVSISPQSTAPRKYAINI